MLWRKRVCLTGIYKIFLILLIVLMPAVMLTLNADILTAQEPGPQEMTRGLVVRVEGNITSGTASMLKNSLEEAERENYDFLLVELDTPGGVLNPTLRIMSDFLEAPLPVITYVSPSGAISASAGSFLLLSGHKAVMTPGTSTGAAMPVQFSPGGTRDAADEKTINFIEGHIRSVARERGRNEEIAGQFVTENLTLTADEALEEGVIDLISRNRDQLLEGLDGEEVMIRGEPFTLSTAGAELVERDMSTGERLENFLGNPQVTFILMLVGIYGLIIGFSSPGTIIPEVGGAISLALALYGLGIIEVDYLGLALMGLGVVFLVAELFTPTFGIFTSIGVVLLVVGGFIFPGEPLMPAEWFESFRMFVLGLAAMTAVFILVILQRLISMRKKAPSTSDLGLRGNTGYVSSALNPEGQIKLEGELWRARSVDDEVIDRAEKVEVINRQGMVLLVRRTGAEKTRSNNEEG